MKAKSDTKNRFVIVMAGGRGERFWPVSREQMPKQLLTLLGKKSFLQEAVERVLPLVPAKNIFIITNVPWHTLADCHTEPGSTSHGHHRSHCVPATAADHGAFFHHSFSSRVRPERKPYFLCRVTPFCETEPECQD